ncbi:hypothetical protein [Stieleria varia]|uniref:Uncharacterized protein n=1 Tax=Stieleria varia TaxID=2528005 RepID=A0A5C6B8B7_9BACT|nr:hypothetical protein [Stieleria varia]TWU07496.1 hypothetical protein Pla52n_00690 [Stieleria varia]
MNQAIPDAKKLESLRKMAFGIGLNFWLGVLATVLSFFENSPAWTFYIVLTAWIGVVMGLTGGPGFAKQLLGKMSPEQQLTRPMTFTLSLVTFWIPTLAAAVFGLALTGALREGLQPQSHLDDNDTRLIFQVFAMYFLSAGTCWIIVGVAVKQAQQELKASETQPADLGSE